MHRCCFSPLFFYGVSHRKKAHTQERIAFRYLSLIAIGGSHFVAYDRVISTNVRSFVASGVRMRRVIRVVSNELVSARTSPQHRMQRRRHNPLEPLPRRDKPPHKCLPNGCVRKKTAREEKRNGYFMAIVRNSERSRKVRLWKREAGEFHRTVIGLYLFF